MSDHDRTQRVIISGAGPVGCTGALILAQAGIPVTLIEAEEELATDLRASTFHPTTLDLLAKIGLTQKLIPQGLIARRYQYRDRMSNRYAEFDFKILDGLVDHPYRLQCEQFKLTRTVVDWLKDFPHVDVRMGTSVTSVEQSGEGVIATLESRDGTDKVEGRFMIGCDGTRSAVRRSANIEFEGFTYPEMFLVIATDYPLQDRFPDLTDVNYISDPHEWCTILAVPDSWRVLFPTATGADPDELTDPTSMQKRMQRLTQTNDTFNVLHASLYRIHQRVAKTFRAGNMILAGDAAHANNPLGGVGMNSGLHDVINLCDKLIAILHENASTDLLDLYDRQRRTVTIEYIQAQTIQNKRNIEEANAEESLKRLEDLRAIAADHDKAVAFLRRSAMIDALERSYQIT
jgi:3-(3-hydroxy-phenyl)propionate hydroxylase